jgi:hypothetical protein
MPPSRSLPWAKPGLRVTHPAPYAGHPPGFSLVSTNSSVGHFAGVSTPAMAWNAIASSGDVSGSKYTASASTSGARLGRASA